MRIVAGLWRGRRIEAPEGRCTRPTSDRLREALASMVLSALALDLSGARILDAFAGSGALALELLSRGAAKATLVERNPKAARVCEGNIRALGAEARLVRGDAWERAGAGGLPGAPFDIVLLDPPYATDPERLAALIRDLLAHGALARGALVLHERADGTPKLPEAELGATGLVLDRTRRVASSALDLWRYDGASGAHASPLADIAS